MKNTISNILLDFVSEYKSTYEKSEITYENSLIGDIKQINDLLLNERFLPSLQLKQYLDKLVRKARYPIEIAITGQFSSGKSTFLNALLSKDILPTGITPVTSKVNFINYGEEYKLKITYNSGSFEYHAISSIENFTDQRKEKINDIKYLTIYAPIDILKDISFVDTPGLNSQSHNDTQVTKNILRDVGGIIWLTLIDNAGKLSEQEILDKYMPSFKMKSLCVLNQKDKFEQKQIDTTKAYIQNHFSKYFTQVTPISAKLALEAKGHEKSVLIDNSLEELIQDFKIGLKNNAQCKTLKFFNNDFDKFKNKLDDIENIDNQNNQIKMQESNISEVLDFIENTIRPNATLSKEYSIKNDLKNTCDILIKQYDIINEVFDSLASILKKQEQISINLFDEITQEYTSELVNIYNQIDTLIQKISNEIYTNINEKIKIRYEVSQTALFKSEKINKFSYTSYSIDTNTINKNLFYDEQVIEILNKKITKQFKNIQININNNIDEIYLGLKDKLYIWKDIYTKLKKNRELSSDLEFARIRRFASSIYENILQDFQISIKSSISKLNSEVSFFTGTLSFKHEQITRATIAYFEEQILQNDLLHESEPLVFQPKHISQDEITTKLKENFYFHEIENFINSKRNYLYKIIKTSKDEYQKINEEKIEFLKNGKEPYLVKIDRLDEIKSELSSK